jgi:transposase InsO family protein
VFVDRLSKMVHMAPCTKQVSAIGLVRLFENHAWKLHGLPDNFVSDRDVRFQAEFWKCSCEHFGIQHNESSAKHPQSDGKTERTNGFLKTLYGTLSIKTKTTGTISCLLLSLP